MEYRVIVLYSWSVWGAMVVVVAIIICVSRGKTLKSSAIALREETTCSTLSILYPEIYASLGKAGNQ